LQDTDRELTGVRIDIFQYLRSGVRSGEISGDKDFAVIANLLHTLFSGNRVVVQLQPNKKKRISSVNEVFSLLDQEPALSARFMWLAIEQSPGML
jgi:hypothetical protein